MEEKNKIDKFFADQLLQDKHEVDDWFVPSEDIWDKVKPQISNPKPKRKIRGFFWLFLGFISISLLGGGIYFNSDKKTAEYAIHNEIKDSKTATSISKSNIKKEEENGPSTAISNSSKIPVNTSEVSKNDASAHSESKNELEDVKAADNSHYVIEKTLKPQSADLLYEINQSSANNESSKDKEPSQMTNLESKDEKSRKEEVLETDFASESTASATNKLDESSVSESNNSTKILRPKSAFIERIPTLRGQIESEQEAYFPMIDVIGKIDFPKYEFGIVHNEFLIEAVVNEVEETGNPKDMVEVSSKFFSLGATGRKWINRKWSMTSGLTYSTLALDVDISVFDELDSELLEFIYSEVDEVVIDNPNNEDMIVLKDGVMVDIGDELRMDADVGLEISAYQVPFLLDYHIYKNKFEYQFGGGISLDYVVVKQSEIAVDLYKETTLINEPFIQKSITENYGDLSVYTNVGMRYHIHKGINAGVTAKLSILDLPFSSLEFSLNYRL